MNPSEVNRRIKNVRNGGNLDSDRSSNAHHRSAKDNPTSARSRSKIGPKPAKLNRPRVHPIATKPSRNPARPEIATA